MNQRAVHERKLRLHPKDFICVLGGDCQKPIADAIPTNMVVEYGIGYKGTFSKYRVFESYAWMHHIYGRQREDNGGNHSVCDEVIPNYFDPKDFKLSKKEDYFLFVGR